MILAHEQHDIQEGDIILVHSKKGFVPKAIRYFTKCHYNHAAMVIKAMGELYVLEAVENGFILTQTLKEYLKETPKKREILIKRPHNQSWISIQDAYKRISIIIGHKYDFKSLLFSQLIWQLTKENNWKGKKDIKAAKRIYCSEACAFAYSHLFPEWWTVAPVDLFDSKKLKSILKL